MVRYMESLRKMSTKRNSESYANSTNFLLETDFFQKQGYQVPRKFPYTGEGGNKPFRKLDNRIAASEIHESYGRAKP